MKETIYTIPINEAFDKFDGCPVCRLYGGLERSTLEYILGAAMMEPDVRISTNAQGFCNRHMHKMLAVNSRLQLALIIESHLPELNQALYRQAGRVSGKESGLKKARDAANASAQACYVCNRITGFMEHYLGNILYLWKKETGFRDKFDKQPYICLPHYAALLEASGRRLPRGEQAAFVSGMAAVCQRYLTALNEDISAFCKSFDYRNAGAGVSEGAQSAVERATAFLTGVME